VSIGGLITALDQVGNDALALARVAEIVPFAIVIDNAEHLDAVTIGILRTLIRQGGARGVVVVAVDTDLEFSQGPAGGNGPLAEWLDEERRLDRLTILTLSDLTDDEFADLAIHHLGQPVRPEVLAAVVTASDGRPGRLVRLLGVPAVRKALTATTKPRRRRQIFTVTPKATYWSRPSSLSLGRIATFSLRLVCSVRRRYVSFLTAHWTTIRSTARSPLVGSGVTRIVSSSPPMTCGAPPITKINCHPTMKMLSSTAYRRRSWRPAPTTLGRPSIQH
jgi:hypothetical protein